MEYKDQMERSIVLQKMPERIVSLVPSQTELLIDIGLREQLKGVTKFCIHPQGLKKEKIVIGGTKNFHFEKIAALNPDLIIGNKEENYEEGIIRLAEKYPVWMSDIFDLEGALEMMHLLGELTGRDEEARSLIQTISDGFQKQFPFKGTAVYLIWQDPIMAVGKGTFIHDILERTGYKNLVQQERYPLLNQEDLEELNPDYLLLSSEPYPFKNKHVKAYSRRFPKATVKRVDGEMYSWYGSRLARAPEYFRSL